jgi:hypothetical protein
MPKARRLGESMWSTFRHIGPQPTRSGLTIGAKNVTSPKKAILNAVIEPKKM